MHGPGGCGNHMDKMTYKFCFQILGGNSRLLLKPWKDRAALGESSTGGPYAETRSNVIYP